MKSYYKLKKKRLERLVHKVQELRDNSNRKAKNNFNKNHNKRLALILMMKYLFY